MGKVIKLTYLINAQTADHPSPTPSQVKKEELYQSMVDDYSTMLMARRYKEGTVRKSRSRIKELKNFTGKFPWEWTKEDFERYCAYIFKEKGNSVGTQRIKQKDIKKFTEYLIDSKYFYIVRDQYNKILKPICLPDNMIVHKVEYDNKVKRRVFSSPELQKFFDMMDEYIYTCFETRDKALKSAMRDKALFYIMESYGLRDFELRMLDITDLYRNPDFPEFGKFGCVHVRFGKSSRGTGYKERKVWTMDLQTKEIFEWYMNEIRPLFINKNSDDIKALFYSERGLRISIRTIQNNLKKYLYEFGMFKEGLTPHSMRHTFSTINQENPNVSSHLVKQQLGHEYLSTTQHYTHIGDAFIRKNLQYVVDKNLRKRRNKFKAKKGEK